MEVRIKRVRLLNNPDAPIKLTVGAAHEVVLERSTSTWLEAADTLYHLESAVPMPETLDEENDDAGVIEVVSSAYRVSFEAETPQKVLVVGHTDTSGSNEFNDELSTERAAVLHALLIGDETTFGTLCEERHVRDDDEFVMAWVAKRFGWRVNFDDHGQDPVLAFFEFRREFNASPFSLESGHTIPDNAKYYGAAYWTAIFFLYESEVARILDTDNDGLDEYRETLDFLAPEHVGCGENFPIDQVGFDGVRSQTNRRSEILFFDPDELPKMDCHAGDTCRPELCQVHNPLLYHRVPLPIDPEDRPPDVLASRLPCSYELGDTFPKGIVLDAFREIKTALESAPNGRFMLAAHSSIAEENQAELNKQRLDHLVELLEADEAFFLDQFKSEVWGVREVKWMLGCVPGYQQKFPHYCGETGPEVDDSLNNAIIQYRYARELSHNYEIDEELLDNLVADYLAPFKELEFPVDRIIKCKHHCPDLVPLHRHERERGLTAESVYHNGGNSTIRRLDAFLFVKPIRPDPSVDREDPTEAQAAYTRWCNQATRPLVTQPAPFQIKVVAAQDIPVQSGSVSFSSMDEDETTEAVEAELTEFGLATVRLEPGMYLVTFDDTETAVEVDHSTANGVFIRVRTDEFHPLVREVSP